MAVTSSAETIPFTRETFVRNITPTAYPTGVVPGANWEAHGGVWDAMIPEEIIYWGAPWVEPNFLAPDELAAKVARAKQKGLIGLYMLPKGKTVADILEQITIEEHQAELAEYDSDEFSQENFQEEAAEEDSHREREPEPPAVFPVPPSNTTNTISRTEARNQARANARKTAKKAGVGAEMPGGENTRGKAGRPANGTVARIAAALAKSTQPAVAKFSDEEDED